MRAAENEQGASLLLDDLSPDQFRRIAIAFGQPRIKVGPTRHLRPVDWRISEQHAQMTRVRKRTVHLADRAKEFLVYWTSQTV